MDSRKILILATKFCEIFDEITPNEFRTLLYLRMAELPVHIKKMEAGVSEKRLRDIITEYKRKGVISQKVINGPISLTPTGNKLLDQLLERLTI